MPDFRVAAALLVLAAPWARAQRVAAPVRSVAGPAVVAAPVPVLSAPAILSPAATLAPSLPAPAALAVFSPPAPVRPQAAAPLKLAAVSAAIARFDKIDLKSAPAAEIRGGADDLMARALGAEIEEAPALAAGALSAPEISLAPFEALPAREPVSGPGVHLLSKPLHATVELGPFARGFYYALEAAFALVKAAVTWHATGSPAAVAAMLAFDAVKAPGSLTAESLMDLNLRYWRRKLSTLKRLADAPGVARIRVLTTGQAEFSGMLARRKDNTGLVFVDSVGPLPAEIPGFGAPIAVSDLEGRTVRLSLVRDGASSGTAWTPTLAELLSGRPVPPEVAADWRASLEAGNKGRSALGRLFDFKKDKDLRVEAYLSDGRGGESPLGAVVFGGAVKSLVGLGRWDRVGALFGRRAPSRAIPISDTLVERDGRRVVKGWARRLWRRLTGALIVR